jgi:hypothetical protein
MGASAIAPPIAAAANHGATYLIDVFMMISCAYWFALTGLIPIIALEQADVVAADTHSTLQLAVIGRSVAAFATD